MKKSINLTDLGNARFLVKGDSKDLKYVPKYGWLVWQGGRWAKDETGEVERRAKGSTTRDGLTAPWPIGRRRQRPKSPGHQHSVLFPGVDFKWSQV